MAQRAENKKIKNFGKWPFFYFGRYRDKPIDKTAVFAVILPNRRRLCIFTGH
jgi:hypothetical protein